MTPLEHGMIASIPINKAWPLPKRTAFVISKAVDRYGNPSFAAIWLKTDGTIDRGPSMFVLTKDQVLHADPIGEAALFENSDATKAARPVIIPNQRRVAP